MRIYCDTASLAEIEEWNEHPWVSGFTTNPTLMRGGGLLPNVETTEKYPGVPYLGMDWAKELIRLTDKPVSIDGPPEVRELGPNVWRKIVADEYGAILREFDNLTAVCSVQQLRNVHIESLWTIVSVFAGRIMDTGRDPQPVIDAAKQTGAQVLWASVREPYNIRMAEEAGCDIVTVPPAILRKYLEFHGKPLEVVAAETIAQFERDSEGLW